MQDLAADVCTAVEFSLSAYYEKVGVPYVNGYGLSGKTLLSCSATNTVTKHSEYNLCILKVFHIAEWGSGVSDGFGKIGVSEFLYGRVVTSVCKVVQYFSEFADVGFKDVSLCFGNSSDCVNS